LSGIVNFVVWFCLVFRSVTNGMIVIVRDYESCGLVWFSHIFFVRIDSAKSRLHSCFIFVIISGVCRLFLFSVM